MPGNFEKLGTKQDTSNPSFLASDSDAIVTSIQSTITRPATRPSNHQEGLHWHVQAVFGNVGTLVAFRIGYTDAEVMTKEFGKSIPATALADLNQYEAVVKLLVGGENREPFRAKMLPPLENRIGRRDKLIALSRERFAMPRERLRQS
jgi:hypothetical protein